MVNIQMTGAQMVLKAFEDKIKYGKFRQTHGITYPGKPEHNGENEVMKDVQEESKD